jgi:ATP-dependent exoDNAse (exonuclease V) alpha subunit
MMKATIAAIEQGTVTPGANHTKVFVFAPSAQASRKVLRDEGFKDADTVEQLLSNPKMQDKVKGQVLWIDEAGLMSSRDMRRVFELAQVNDCRVILSGDYRQHSSVARGDSLRLLESEAGVRFAELKTIRRQKETQYRQAVEAISEGTARDAAKGFDRLDAMGAIIEANGEDRHKLLVADMLQAAKENKSALVIAPTHREGDALTEEIRSALKAEGYLGTKEHAIVARTPTNWTNAQRGDARNYREGQIVQFHKAVAGSRSRKDGGRFTTGGFEKSEAAVVIGSDDTGVRVLKLDGTQSILPLGNADRFSVYNTRELAIAEGEKLRITANGQARAKGLFGDKAKRINNGDVFTVEGFTETGDLKLGHGVVLPQTYGNINYAYCDTSHAAQGKTVDRVFIAVGEESLRAASRAQWYVSVSRGREEVKVYTDSKEDLKEAVQRSAERLSAVELVKQSGPRRPSLTEILLERNRVARFMKERADAVRRSWRESRQKGIDRG